MADEMSVTLPDGVLGPIIQAQVVAALQGQERLITELVTFVMSQKVRDGQSYKESPFIEKICRDVLREAIEAAVREWVGLRAKEIQTEVDKQLRAKTRGIAAKLVQAMVDGANNKWQLTVNAQINDKSI